MAGKARPSRVKPRPVEAAPAAPFVRHEPVVPPQVVTQRPVYRCPHCGSANVRRNGGSLLVVAYFVCGRCTDDDGSARTFKLPVAP